ncbi:hypothetical protein ACFT5B_08045, partial [Luteimicrobium sp. NPDC057192]|uniref:hypothetical protein n=1 Tax=Luteimicrobium sp. NPDC057192 TaxID=3346042 RepID=UPI0036251F18
TTLGHDSVVEAVPRSSLSVVVTDAAHDDPTLVALAGAGTVVRAVPGATRPVPTAVEPALSRAS